MTVRSFGGVAPRIHPTAWVSEAAYVVGDVEIGPGSSVWPGAVIRGDYAPIRIGSNTHIEDNTVVHTGEMMTVGDNIIVGHGVVLHCARVESQCLIGSNATLLDGAVIGERTLVAAGSLLTRAAVVPPRSFVVGVPATVRAARPDQVASLDRLERTDAGYASMARAYRDAGL